MTQAGPSPPKTPKSAATRRRLLTEAHRLFIDRGYSAVSLNDIAEAVGLTKGAIYGHFRSKGQLLIEVIRTELTERDRQAAGVEPTEDMIPSFVAEGARELRLLQLDAAAAARHDDDVARGLTELIESRLRWIADLSAASLPRGSGVDTETFAFVVTALAQGVGALEAGGTTLPDAEHFAAVVGPMLRSSFR